MPVAVSYPGVYIQEVSSGVSTITGVATSIGAFVDCFSSGPLNEPTEVLSFADFERQFGGLYSISESSYGIQQFFANGGSQAYVVRVTSATTGKGAASAAIALENQVGGTAVLTATAADPGAWGNSVRLEVDYGTTDPTSQFNLTVTEISVANGITTVTATEQYLNLVINPSSSQDAAAVVNAASQLITLAEASGSSGSRPAQTGTTSKAIANANANFAALNLAAADTTTVALVSQGTTTQIGTTGALGTTLPTTLAGLATALQGLIRALQTGGQPALPNATVTVVGSSSTTAFLVVEPGTANPADYLTLTDAGGLATKLGFATATANVQQYALGGAAVQAQATPGGTAQSGSDDKWDLVNDATGITSALIGDPNAKTGIYALMNIDLFNILCIPATMNLPDVNAAAVATAATGLCTTRRAMYILDVPQRTPRDTVPAIQTWLDANAGLRSRNAALYFPRLDIPDPLNNYRLRKVSPSGTLAGVWADTDGSRGVWKAPAGTAATLTGVQALEYQLTDPENGVLNPLAINCLRNFPIYGPVAWGARTLFGSDQMADDYKYIPVRRLALYIEESLYRGTQWVVFEPNDTPLWSAIRLNVGAFMQTLFRQGAFQGSTPQQAYFVLCDSSTNPQATINQGIVNILVGFAPLKPAEFVVITIQQIAGQLAT
jgi:phage tail sheath protein FI